MKTYHIIIKYDIVKYKRITKSKMSWYEIDILYLLNMI